MSELIRELPDWIDGWLEFMDNSEAPIIYHKWVAVSIIAAALERKVFLQWDKELYPNFYIVLVGPPATRKGSAMGPGRRMLGNPDIKVQLVADVTTKEKLALTFMDATKEFRSEEGFGFNEHSSLTLYSEEFTVFLGYDNKDLLPWLCDWYDCKENWAYTTKHQKETVVKNLWLNIIGATTPDLLQDVLPRESFGSGLNSRIIYVYAGRKGKNVLFPHLAVGKPEIWDKLESDLGIINLMQGEFQADQSYMDVWARWYPKNEEVKLAKDSRMSGYIGRRPTHLHKLAMILNISRDGGLILTAEDLLKGLEMLDEVESCMLETFSGMGRSETSQITERVLAYIRASEGIRYSELLRHFRNDANAQELALVVATLDEANLVNVAPIKENGLLLKDRYITPYNPLRGG